MSAIAIIPARGGSKRIPRKNIRDFLGKPIIAYSIQSALSSGLFEEVMVSTDDHEIAAIARQQGAQVPFFRSEKNADDHAGTMDVLFEVLEAYRREGRTFDNACCIYPTAPLIQQHRLREAYDLLKSESFTSVFPVVAFSYPIWRALKVENNKPEMFWPENEKKRSQDLPTAWHDAGQFYWFVVEKILNGESIIGKNSGVIKLDEIEVQDIDNESDWKLAELKASMLKIG